MNAATEIQNLQGSIARHAYWQHRRDAGDELTAEERAFADQDYTLHQDRLELFVTMREELAA